MSAAPDVILVCTTFPDRASAEKLALYVVEQRLAACVNILAECTSVYAWQGQLERSSEIPLLIKTSAGRYAALEAAIHDMHPYELPEVIQVSVEGGLPAYLDWIAQQTQ